MDARFSEDLKDQRDQDLDARATAFKEEIEKRLASGPATPMDFPEIKRKVAMSVRRTMLDSGRR
jgi:hypothetical protein